ncbi:hypothetical protein SteCoe_27164 [Stentor coeruleus]|uniref:Uncharacterized protein n=1 Tax=Stentor coeruleus TaxID=5963 RepID=A0A1R2BB72_9CILI|nr:hypothetical protein SteCoe_27164 [Stentor coeruleus]
MEKIHNNKKCDKDSDEVYNKKQEIFEEKQEAKDKVFIEKNDKKGKGLEDIKESRSFEECLDFDDKILESNIGFQEIDIKVENEKDDKSCGEITEVFQGEVKMQRSNLRKKTINESENLVKISENDKEMFIISEEIAKDEKKKSFKMWDENFSQTKENTDFELALEESPILIVSQGYPSIVKNDEKVLAVIEPVLEDSLEIEKNDPCIQKFRCKSEDFDSSTTSKGNLVIETQENCITIVSTISMHKQPMHRSVKSLNFESLDKKLSKTLGESKKTFEPKIKNDKITPKTLDNKSKTMNKTDKPKETPTKKPKAVKNHEEKDKILWNSDTGIGTSIKKAKTLEKNQQTKKNLSSKSPALLKPQICITLPDHPKPKPKTPQPKSESEKLLSSNIKTPMPKITPKILAEVETNTKELKKIPLETLNIEETQKKSASITETLEKSLLRVPETILEHNEEKTPTTKYSSCDYVNAISVSEYYLKSIMWLLQSVNLRSSYPIIPPIENKPNEFCSIQSASDIPEDCYLIPKTKHLPYILFALSYKLQWAKAQNDEIAFIQDFSDQQNTAYEQLDLGKKSIQSEELQRTKEFKNSLENLKGKTTSLSFSLSKKTLEIEEDLKTKAFLQGQLDELTKENSQIEDQISNLPTKNTLTSQMAEISYSLRSYKEKTQHLMRTFKEKSQKQGQTLLELTKSLNMLRGKCIDLEKSCDLLERENTEMTSQVAHSLLKASNSSKKTKRVPASQIKSDLLKLDQDRAKLKSSSLFLINKIESSNKTYKLTQQNYKKNLDSLSKSIIISTPLTKTINSIPALSKPSPLAFPNNPLDFLPDFIYSLASNMLTIPCLSYNLQTDKNILVRYMKEINHQGMWSNSDGHVDQIDELMSHFIIFNSSEVPFVIKREKSGVYRFGNKMVQVAVQNFKLVVKCGNRNLPIQEYLKITGKRTNSLNRSPARNFHK